MFANHQKKVSDFARQSPDNMAKVLKFVVLSIRTRLWNLPADMETLEAVERGEIDGPEAQSILYGFKYAAVTQIEAEKEHFYAQAESIVYHAESEREAARALLNLFSQVHGLGLAKAGFAAQLIYGVSGCLDSHNLERFGIPGSVIKSATYKNAKTNKTRWKRIDTYCDLVDKFGGTESLWDSWCEYVAARPDETGKRMNGNKLPYSSAFDVSALHCTSLGIEP